MRSNEEIVTIIENRMNEKGLSMSELARRVGMAKSALSRYFNRTREFPLNRVNDFAKELNLSPEYVLGFDKYNNDISTLYNQLDKSRQAKVYSFAEHQLEEQNKVIHIHKDNGDYVTETLRGYLSAGTGELQLEEVLEEVEIPVEIIPEQHYDMLLQINGDSMLPMFQDGERIFVRKIEDASELRSGQIGVFIIDGESYLKKAYKEDNQLRLVSLNDKYEDLIFNEINDIEVIGTVVM